MQDFVLPKPWVPVLIFSSLRSPTTGNMGLFSSGSPFGVNGRRVMTFYEARHTSVR